jgi:hypothetical protein
MTTIDYTETLSVTHCWCGIAVAIPENLMSYARRHKGKEIFCPLGHEFIFGNSIEEQLAEEKRRHRATRDLLNAEEAARRAEERSHAETRGKLTRQRTRAKVGVCPVCHRTISQMARHMASKHPGFDPAADPEQHEEHEHHEHREHVDAEARIVAYLTEHGATRFGVLRDALGFTQSRTSYLLTNLLSRNEVERYMHGIYRVPA